MKRGTKKTRSGRALDSKGQIIKEDPKIVVANRFKDLCCIAVGVSSKAAESGDASAVLARKLMEADIEVDRFCKFSPEYPCWKKMAGSGA